MGEDYYQVLGIDPSADFDAIKKAYRRKVMECHPDRGGSHERMVVVNEAWQILSDPDLRQRYDEARNPFNNASAQAAATADANSARHRAEQYPRRWVDFEKWLNTVAGDFSAAQHGSTRLFGDVHFPTVNNSISGCLFIVVGVALAGFFISTATANFCEQNKIKGSIAIVLVVGPLVLGAWAGAVVHQGIGNTLKETQKKAASRSSKAEDRPKTDSPSPRALEPRIFVCEKCGQKLRVPSLPSEILITCKSCGHKFPCSAV